MTLTSRLVQIFCVVWTVLIVLYLVGVRTTGLFPIAFGLTFLVSVRYPAFLIQLIDRFRALVRPWFVYLFVGIISLATFCSHWFLWDSFNGSQWDLTTYIQWIYSKAMSGTATMTINDALTQAEAFHSSLAVPILGQLYRWLPHPALLLTWQSLFFIAPAWVGLLWYRAICKKHRTEAEPFGYLLLFASYLFTPVFAGQFVWPYVFHIAGLFFLALAYLFFFEKRWIPWALSLLAFASQKEEFGLYAAFFAVTVAIDAAIDDKADAAKPKAVRLALCLAVLLVGVVHYFAFTKTAGELVPFAVRFGNLGLSPSELAANLFKDPFRFVAAFLRPAALSYFAFFFCSSLVWWRPNWSSIKFWLPVFPFLILQCMAGYEQMHLLKDHYALPIAVGTFATALLGVASRELRGERRVGNKQLFLALVAASIGIATLWGHENPVRVCRHFITEWAQRAPERKMLANLREDRALVLCCEGRLCAWFADRNYVLPAETCAGGSKLLRTLHGSHAIYLLNAQTKVVNSPAASQDILAKDKLALPIPDTWPISTPLLKASQIMLIP